MQSEPKPKWEITKITRSQNTKRTISQKVNTLLPYPNEILPRHIEVENTKTDTETSKTESNIRSTALERSVITLLSCLHGNNIFKLAAYQHRLVGCPLGVPISYYRYGETTPSSSTLLEMMTTAPHMKVIFL